MDPNIEIRPNLDLLTKRELSERIKVSQRTIDTLIRRKVIPVVRLSARCIRFHSGRVAEALAKLEVHAL